MVPDESRQHEYGDAEMIRTGQQALLSGYALAPDTTVDKRWRSQDEFSGSDWSSLPAARNDRLFQ